MSIGVCHAVQYGAEKPEPALNALLSVWANTVPSTEKQGLLAGLFVAWAEHKAAQSWSKLIWSYFIDFWRHLLLSLPSSEAAVNPGILSHHPVS